MLVTVLAWLAVAAPWIAGAAITASGLIASGWMIWRWDTGFDAFVQDLCDMIMPRRDDA